MADENGEPQYAPREHPPPSGLQHTVKQGENLESIAYRYGHFSEYLWNHPRNQELRDERKDRNILAPQDSVWVPPPRLKTEPRDTGRRHVFRRRGVPSLFRFRALAGGVALANLPWTVEMEGKTIGRGSTDKEGLLQCFVPPDAPQARVTIGNPPFQRVYDVTLRTVDPVTMTSGIQARLHNLGLLAGEPDGEMSDATRQALREFQQSQGLVITGEPDDNTRERLKAVHGS